MERAELIYFDNAATSFPKPVSVYSEVGACMLSCGGNAGRGSHKLSAAAAEKIFECRVRAAELFGSDHPERVVFTLNTTYALNMALKGLLNSGDHVVISDLEHNAVYRPICALSLEKGVQYDVFDTMTCTGADDTEMCRGISGLIKGNTKMIVCTCSSNVCSRLLPIEMIGRLCRKKGLLFVLDAAQGAGHIDINMKKMNIDVLCVPSHKGLYGPQGCGMAIFNERVNCRTVIEGGNGYDSLKIGMGDAFPERFEAGTLPAYVIAGLSEGIKSVMEIGISEISAHEQRLCARASEMLGNTEGVRVYLPRLCGSVLSFNVQGFTSEQVAALLDIHGICVRGGYHCAALAHRTLGTQDGGTVRLSFGRYNRLSELERFARVLKQILKGNDFC